MTRMQRPSFDVPGFLGEPGRPASVATVTAGGHPAASAGYRLWSMSPDRGMAVAYPGLADGPVFSWAEPAAFAALGS
jgi:hypothetical protein